MEEETIKILLANDHALFRSGITNALHKSPHIRVIALAVSFPDIYIKLLEFKPDILMTDDRMPGGDLISDHLKIKELYPDLKIIANSMFGDIGYLKKLMQITDGLVSFVAKEEDFIKAVEAVHNGGLSYYFPGLKK